MVVGELFLRNAEKFSGKIGVIFEDHIHNFGELNQRVNRLGNGLMGLGVKKSDRVAALMGNCHQLLEVIGAGAKSGAIITFINPRLMEREISYILEDSEARVLMFSKQFLGLVLENRKKWKDIQDYVCVGGVSEEIIEYDDLLLNSKTEEPNVNIDENDIFRLIYTSGTTGTPKGVMISHRNVIADCVNGIIEYPIEEDSINLQVAPLYLATACHAMMHLYRGCTNVILQEQKFNPALILETIQREKVTYIYLAPTMLIRLLDYADLTKYDLGSLRTIPIAGSPIPAETFKAAMNVFGNIFLNTYGLTECTTLASVLKPKHISSFLREDNEKILESCGKPFVNAEVNVVDEFGKTVGQEQTGEVIVKGENIMKGYWRMPEATEEAITDGWLHTGDIGFIDKDGFLYLVDRKKDMIISGGYNIYPREIEEVLYKHPAISEVAVVGVPDDHWGETVKAIVKLKEGTSATPEDIMDFCKTSLAGYKRPHSVDFVDDFSRTASGKIKKKELRDYYWKGRKKV